MPSSVDRDGPAVARGDGQVDARRVERVGQHRDVDIGNVAARADQLFVAHDQLRIERVARFEKQVAADDALAGEAVGLVGGAFEPVAPGVEDLPAVDGDFTDGFPGVGLQQAAFVGHPAAHGGIEDGFHEKHLVEHARHGAAVGFRLDAVVEPLVAGRGVGIRHPGAVGGETVGHMRTGACDAGERGGRRRSQGQYQYAEPGIHSVKITFFSGIKYGKSHPEALRMRKKVHPKVNLFLLRRPGGAFFRTVWDSASAPPLSLSLSCPPPGYRRPSLASIHSVAWGTFIRRSLGMSLPVVLQMP